MKVYDRYGGSPAHARSARRAAFLTIILKLIGYCLVWLAVLGAAHLAGRERTFWYILILGGPALLGLIAAECLYPLLENDLLTFGYDGRSFAVLGIRGKARRVIAVDQIGCIRLEEACSPFGRGKRTVRFFGRAAIYEPYGERRRIRGKKRFLADVMVLPEPRDYRGKEYPGWMEKIFIHKTGEFLCSHVGFIPRGENRRIFVRLLADTRCPVVIRRDFYRLHRRRLDALFGEAGLDMNRLRIDGE